MRQAAPSGPYRPGGGPGQLSWYHWVDVEKKETLTPGPVKDEQSAVGQIDDERIKNADQEPGNWLAYGRSYEEQRFSPLEQINRSNVSRLDLEWVVDMHSTRALEATPIVVDGMMFVSSEWSRVHAFDAVSGKEIWFYDPKVPGEWARKACCGVVNRGVAVYEGRVYFATLDGRLIALDAASGKPVWEVDTLIDRQRDYTITRPHRVITGITLQYRTWSWLTWKSME